MSLFDKIDKKMDKMNKMLKMDERLKMDEMFKKNAFDQKMDDAYESFAENNPVTRKAKTMIDDNANKITHSLEWELHGENPNPSEKRSFVDGDGEAMMEQWDSMIDQLFEKELDAYKVCPNCLEAVSAELECCPHCGTQLPDHTAAIQICPHCGAKNRIFDLKCANCGKELEQFPGANDESNQK